MVHGAPRNCSLESLGLHMRMRYNCGRHWGTHRAPFPGEITARRLLRHRAEASLEESL